jgi:uncharacterized protein DUF3631
MPDALHDRAQDNWEPLIAIADLAGGGWPKLARDAASALSGAVDPGDDTPDWISSAELTTGLVALEDRPWAENTRASR